MIGLVSCEQQKRELTTENIAVYETLRNNIISCEERITNEKIYMYVVYFALLAFGVERTGILMLSYLVLIVFQTMINRDRTAIEKASAYIRIFFEEKGDIHWESLHKEQRHLRAYWTKTRNIGWYIEKFSSSLLALTTLLILLITFLQRSSFCKLPLNLALELIAALFLCIAVLFLNTRLYTNNGDIGGEIENSIRLFYKECYEQKKNHQFGKR